MKKFKEKFDELFGIDLRALACMRIGLSLLILIDLAVNFPYIRMFYSDEGILPSSFVSQSWLSGAFSLNLINGSFTFQLVLYAMLFIFTFSLLVGYRTQLSTFLVWILLVSFYNRNLLVTGAEDKILVVILFWFLFLPLGAWYSLDSLRKDQPPTAQRVSSMASVAYLLQISFIYFFCGHLKTYPQWTTDYTAAGIALSGMPFVKPLGHGLLQYPALLKCLTFAVLNLERWGPLFFFCPFYTVPMRVITVVAFMCFHAGLLLTMELGLFQWISLTALLGFLPTVFWDKITSFLKQKPKHKTAQSMSRKKSGGLLKPLYLNSIVGFLILYVLWWNIGGLNNSKLPTIPQDFKWIGKTLNLNQRWVMYAPQPFWKDGWFVIPAKLQDGRQVDMLQDSEKLIWHEPRYLPKHYKNYRLTLFYFRMYQQRYAQYAKPWAEYLCREWNSQHAAGEQVQSLEIIFMETEILPNYKKTDPQQKLIFSQDCSLVNHPESKTYLLKVHEK